MSDEIDKSYLVKNMNQHFAQALQLIQKSAADNNAQIREEVKQFFQCAEEIEKEIAKKEVSDLNYVKQCELDEIRRQKEQVSQFIERFDNDIQQIEGKLRDRVREHSASLIC